MGEILDYLGVEKQYTAEEAATADVPVPRVTGLSAKDAQDALSKKKLNSRVVGSGDVVTAQVPTQGHSIPGGSAVILYMGEEPEESALVPNVVGLGYEAAKKKLETAGFFMRASGASTYYGTASKVQSQSVPADETAPLGTVVDLKFSTPQVEDGYLFTD